MKILPLLLASTVLSPLLSPAVTIYGLTSSNQLVSFDSATPGIVSAPVTIAQAGIVDIDFYPVNGGLYGATPNGTVYRINPTTGAIISTTVSIAPASPSPPISGLTDIDFNPMADRLRIFAGGNTNYRFAPDVINNASPPAAGTTLYDGTFSEGSAIFVGAAYANNFDATSSTTLYSIDSVSNDLFIHPQSGSPQFNTVTSVGDLGFDVGLNVGFDIGQDGIAYLSNNNSLYTVNLATGLASLPSAIGTTGLVSIAAVAVPEASTASVILLTGLCALRRRRA